MVSEFIKKDAFKAFDVLKAGGIAIIPMDVVIPAPVALVLH